MVQMVVQQDPERQARGKHSDPSIASEDEHHQRWGVWPLGPPGLVRDAQVGSTQCRTSTH